MSNKPVKRVIMSPLPVRIWHWINALGIVTLIISGIAIRFPDYVQWFGSFKNAVVLHNTAGIVVTLFLVWWLVYYTVLDRRLVKLYVPTLQDIWPGLIKQTQFYLFGFFKGQPHPYASTPDNKFNPLQKVAYMVMMFVMYPVVCISGLLMLNVGPLRHWLISLGGVKLVIGAHYLAGVCFFSFLFVHLYLATMGHNIGQHYKTMWTGYEDIRNDHH